ncbi:putative ATP-dependent RNA helicase NAM7 [Paratrimastix pyriformis]|uniref:ATP-dependent RNA helicase NAM7 n=1 Tax=Paratrimastix pyriformis TaxID=342808 RepID=A0ABQ8UL51_9EUKA|nr:putative ATP-dependent RNA helicase NAM7 [Paratrimastix pyriformis]
MATPTLHCTKCGALIAHQHEFRLIMPHHVQLTRLLPTLRESPQPKPEKIRKTPKILVCIQCGAKVGSFIVDVHSYLVDGDDTSVQLAGEKMSTNRWKTEFVWRWQSPIYVDSSSVFISELRRQSFALTGPADVAPPAAAAPAAPSHRYCNTGSTNTSGGLPRRDYQPFRSPAAMVAYLEKAIASQVPGKPLVDALLIYDKQLLRDILEHGEMTVVPAVLRAFTEERLTRETLLDHHINEAFGIFSECHFFTTALAPFIRIQCGPRSSLAPPQFADTLDRVVRLASFCTKRIPAFFAEFPLGDLQEALRTIAPRFLAEGGGPIPPEQQARWQEELTRLTDWRAHYERLRLRLPDDPEVTPEQLDAADYHTIPTVPTAADLIGAPDRLLRKNVIRAAWGDTRVYLDAQIRLLRENFLQSLRDGVREILSGNMGTRDILVYDRITVDALAPGLAGGRGPQRRDNALALYVRFKVLGDRRVNWERSERLKFGTLVVLAPFATPEERNRPFDGNGIMAIVQDRDPVTRGLIGLVFPKAEDLARILTRCNQGGQVEWIMVESPCYFKATQPVLEGLVRTDHAQIPFAEVLVRRCPPPDLGPPDYARGARVNLGILYEEAAKRGERLPRQLEYAIDELWPTEAEAEAMNQARGAHLEAEAIDPAAAGEARPDPDPSQLAAIRHILSHKVALVQGPPGAGKTWVGVKAIRLLRPLLVRHHAGPILLVTYTNHALDQFLSLLLPHIPDLVRVGGRSRADDNDPLSQRNLSMLLGTVSNYAERSERRQLRAEIEQLQGEVEALFQQWRQIQALPAPQAFQALPLTLQQRLFPEPPPQLSQPCRQASDRWSDPGYLFGIWFAGSEGRECAQAVRQLAEEAQQWQRVISSRDARLQIEMARQLQPGPQPGQPRPQPRASPPPATAAAAAAAAAPAEAEADDSFDVPSDDEAACWERDQELRATLSATAPDLEGWAPVDPAAPRPEPVTRPPAPLPSAPLLATRRPPPPAAPEEDDLAARFVGLQMAPAAPVAAPLALAGDGDLEVRYVGLPDPGTPSPAGSPPAEQQQQQGVEDDAEALRLEEEDRRLLEGDPNVGLDDDEGPLPPPVLAAGWALPGEDEEPDADADDVDADGFRVARGRGALKKDRRARERARRLEAEQRDPALLEQVEALVDELLDQFGAPAMARAERLSARLTAIIERIRDRQTRADNIRANAVRTPPPPPSSGQGWKSEDRRPTALLILAAARLDLCDQHRMRPPPRDRLAVGAPVVFVEAAELLEPQLLACLPPTCSTSCKSAITSSCVPRRPSGLTVDNYELERNYDFAVSMFERLVNIGLPRVVLRQQVGPPPPPTAHTQSDEMLRVCEDASEAPLVDTCLVSPARPFHPHFLPVALVRPFYESLLDHPRVRGRGLDCVSGVRTNVFFFNHHAPEARENDGHTMKNPFEAAVRPALPLRPRPRYRPTCGMIARLALYLVHQGYAPGEVTILCLYKGQRFAVLEELRQPQLGACICTSPRDCSAFTLAPHLQPTRVSSWWGTRVAQAANGIPCRVVTTDDYQGEENKIIIISLVRSNERDIIGHVKAQNRIVVSLSRATEGMYVLGNGDLMERESADWRLVIGQLRAAGLFGEALTLCCPKHPTKVTAVRAPGDFLPVQHGGCRDVCDEVRPCGHVCKMLCHPGGHDGPPALPREECPKMLPCGHHCPAKCHHGRPCPKCCAMVEKEVPTCALVRRHCPAPPRSRRLGLSPLLGLLTRGVERWFCSLLPRSATMRRLRSLLIMVRSTGGMGGQERHHTMRVRCHEDLAGKPCRVVVEKPLPCGHRYRGPCGDPLLPCNATIHEKLPCGHTVTHRCGTPVPACGQKCGAPLPCGHPCPAKCGECAGRRGGAHAPCALPCTHELACGHPCQAGCGRKCTLVCQAPCRTVCAHGKQCPHPCGEPCVACRERCDWQCPHYRCTRQCGETCNRPVCNRHCPRRLPCGHKCAGVCGEPCPPCFRCQPARRVELEPLTQESFGSLIRDGHLIYMLPQCGHCFELASLDHWMFSPCPDPRKVQLKTCPSCRAPVFTAGRYGNVTKPLVRTLQELKAELHRRAQQAAALTEAELRGIQGALGAEAGPGHWFRCPNRHWYYIADCGGAMVEAQCPECRATIGGQSHTLTAGNTYDPNSVFNRGQGAAWPTMAFGHLF